MSRKLTVTLILILFLLPFVSWYYLNSGLKWRQQAQVAMSGTSPVAGLPFMTTRGTRFEASMLEDHVSLLIMLTCGEDEAQQSLIESFYQQFKETKKANFIFFDTCALQDRQWLSSMTYNTWTVSCHDTVNHCEPLLQAWPTDKHYALVDKLGVVRSYYDAKDKDHKRILLEHMALLIPREHSEKVELKRSKE